MNKAVVVNIRNPQTIRDMYTAAQAVRQPDEKIVFFTYSSKEDAAKRLVDDCRTVLGGSSQDIIYGIVSKGSLADLLFHKDLELSTYIGADPKFITMDCDERLQDIRENKDYPIYVKHICAKCSSVIKPISEDVLDYSTFSELREQDEDGLTIVIKNDTVSATFSKETCRLC